MSAKDLPTYTREEVKKHNTVEDCWIIYMRKVYAFPQTFIEQQHPGGPILMDAAGTDGTDLFEDNGHGEGAREELAKFIIGRVEG